MADMMTSTDRRARVARLTVLRDTIRERRGAQMIAPAESARRRVSYRSRRASKTARRPRTPRELPGTLLFQRYKSWGIAGCTGCNKLRRQMDIWGAAGCRERLSQIVSDILPRAEKWWHKQYPAVVARAFWEGNESWIERWHVAKDLALGDVRSALRTQIEIHVRWAIVKAETDAYWSERGHLEYYATALQYVREFGGPPGTLLDVGGGVQFGARYLQQLPDWRRTSVELPSERGGRLDGVELVQADFLSWKPTRRYDVVLCLQTLEHVPDAAAFARKLFDSAVRLVVLSVPCQWPAGADPSHVHDPVTAQKLRDWTSCDPHASAIVDTPPRQRVVCVYRLR